MKKIYLLLSITTFAFNLSSQVTLTENFNAPFTPNGTAWAVQNNSSPVGPQSWFQGNTVNWPAYNGAPNSYYSANFMNTTGAGCISNWLITPTVNIYNGAVLSFATRCAVAGSPPYPDRMQVRMSTAGTSTAVGTGTASVGNFTNLLLDINPLYSVSTSTTVNAGVVNGYPDVWTVYSLTVTGQSTPVTGRFAFRYFVENAGPGGSNSDVIGIDAVKYEEPCGATIPSYTTCAGITTTLAATGGLGQTTYSWNTGATSESIIVNPSTVTGYTLTSLYPGGVCPNTATGTITPGTSLSMNVLAPSATMCSGNSSTLTLVSGASSYTWFPGLQTSQSITVNPSSTQVYTVAGENGACSGSGTFTLNVNPTPTVTASSSNYNTCTGQQFTLTGTGATNYTWSVGAITFTFNPIVLSNTVAGVYNFFLTGVTNGCSMVTSLSQTVSACTDIDVNNMNNSNIIAFPNPFSGEISISGIKGSIQIFNTLGQMLISASVNENETINTANLATGVYIVKILDCEGREVKMIRMVKN